MTIYERPPGMSQLDWLVTTFGEYTIAEQLSDTKAILTTDLLDNLVLEGSGIVKLKAVESDKDTITLYGYDAKGNTLTSATLNKNTEVIAFEKYTLTKMEEDKGIGQVGDVYYRISLSNGQYLYAPTFSGVASKTIITEVLDDKISSSLRISNPIQDKSVKLTATDNGLRADLIIDEQSESNIQISIDKGVSAKLKWIGEEELVGFQNITWDQYNLINPRTGVIYFVEDQHKICLNGIVYPLSVNVDLEEINHKIEILNQRITDLIGFAPEDLDTLEEVAEAIKRGNEIYQRKGNYVEYTIEDSGRKHIILSNNDSITGTLKDGSDGRNLIMLSKWDVVDVGSNKNPINLNGSEERPTYNDNKQIALKEDVDNIEQNFNWKLFD